MTTTGHLLVDGEKIDKILDINIPANSEQGTFWRGEIFVKILKQDAVVANQLQLLRAKEVTLVVNDGRKFNVEVETFALSVEGSSISMNANIHGTRTSG